MCDAETQTSEPPLDEILRNVKGIIRLLDMHEGTCKDVEYEIKGHLHDYRFEAEKLLQGLSFLFDSHK